MTRTNISIKRKANNRYDETKDRNQNYLLGTLTDQDIRDYVNQGKLISDNFEGKCIKQACYELRASNIYYHPIESDEKKEVEEEESGILLRPHQLIVIITKEYLDIPPDILGRILTKGSLFSLGVNAVNTYVDPGFKGRLGIVFQNQTTKYLKILVNQPIAKIEFSKLHKPVKDSYHGQHGYETEIWPINRNLFVDKKELKEKFKIVDPLDEIGLLYGDPIESVLKRVIKFERRMIAGVIIYFIITMLYLGIVFYFEGTFSGVFEPIISVLIGIAANFIFAIVSSFFSKK